MSPKANDLKEKVKQKYSEIARNSNSGCCGPTDCCGSDEVFSVMAESYEKLDGYHPDADLSLGCGIPVEFAGLQEGHRVLDLGSGAGNDLFVARSIAGQSGWLTGVDFSEEMNEKARKNQEKLGFRNMEFISGDIESLPLDDDSYDVVLSNCVLNLVPDKKAAFSEIFRVLRPGGHFTISDIVLEGELNEWVRKSAELYAGCVSGAIEKNQYLEIVENAGFQQINIVREREIIIPGEWLLKHFGRLISIGNSRILSITLKGFKPV